jgi:hypothetical protein
METLPALSHEVWERTPPEAQAYIRALEMRVATLEGMQQALQEQLHQTSRNSSRPRLPLRIGEIYYARLYFLC